MVSSKVTPCSCYSGRFCREKNKLQDTQYLSAKISFSENSLFWSCFSIVALFFRGLSTNLLTSNTSNTIPSPFWLVKKTRFLSSMHQRWTSSSFHQRWKFVLPQRVTFYPTEVLTRSFHRTRLPTSFYDETKISFCVQYDIYRLFSGPLLQLLFISQNFQRFHEIFLRN